MSEHLSRFTMLQEYLRDFHYKSARHNRFTLGRLVMKDIER